MTDQTELSAKLNPAKTERKHFLDLLRVAATLAVVLLHTLSGAVVSRGYFVSETEKFTNLTLTNLITWCVPVFLLISGYLFLNPERQISVKEMLGKYCMRVFWALVVFGIPYAGIELVLKEKCFRFDMIYRSVWMTLTGQTWAHMWYLYLVLLLYLCTPALKWVLKKVPMSVVYLVLVVLAVSSSFLPYIQLLFNDPRIWTLWGQSIYLFYYLAGYGFAVRKKEISGLQAAGLFTLVVLLIAFVLYSRITGHFWVELPYNHPVAALFALCFMGLGLWGEKYLQQKNTALLEKISGLCFGIYLTHPIFLNILYKGMHVSAFDTKIPFIVLPLIWLGAFVCAMVLSGILAKIKWMRKHVL